MTLEELLRQLGKWFPILRGTVPFLLGLTVYKFFKMLDGRASDQASATLKTFLANSRSSPDVLLVPTLFIFDFVYGSPLFRPRSLRRIFAISATISLLWQGGLLLERNIDHEVPTDGGRRWAFIAGFVLAQMLVVFAADVLSSIVIRASIIRFHKKASLLLLSAIIAFIAALAIAGFVFFSCNILLFGAFHGLRFDIDNWGMALSMTLSAVTNPRGFMLVPASVIHLWLPLFAAASISLRLMAPVRKATRAVMWFLKGGNDHSFEAVGLVAATFVFVILTSAQIAYNLIEGG